jgi:hypothetical protein
MTAAVDQIIHINSVNKTLISIFVLETTEICVLNLQLKDYWTVHHQVYASGGDSICKMTATSGHCLRKVIRSIMYGSLFILTHRFVVII